MLLKYFLLSATSVRPSKKSQSTQPSLANRYSPASTSIKRQNLPSKAAIMPNLPKSAQIS